MQTSRCNLILVGLPGAGKTTFLAALWHVVNSREIEAALQLERLHGDQGYLNRIRDLWADANALERTKPGHEHVLSMLLRAHDGAATTELILPDLSGESFQQQWTDRQMTVEHERLILDSVGGLLLVHPEQIHEETLISDTDTIVSRVKAATPELEQAASTADHGSTDGATADDLQTAWNATETPTQVQLVELLQFVSAISLARPMRLGIVVSAWDCVRENNGAAISPMEWTQKRLPLLAQYLSANVELFTTQYYGVSAQGDKLDNAERLRKVVEPSHRIIVLDDEMSESHDITLPIRRIMGCTD